MKRISLFICFLLFSQAAWAAETIKIGFMGPLSGDFVAVGIEAKQVVELLARDTNDHGGILGRKVEVICEDDGGKPRIAAAAAKRLVRQGVVAVIGSYTSSITESVQKVFDNGKVIQMAYGSTAIPLTEKKLKYFFRTCPRDDEQAKAAVRIIQKMKIRKVALLHDNSLYGKGLAEAIKKLLKDSMISVVFYDALIPGRQDYSDILTKIKGTDPEFFFFSGYYPEAARLLEGRDRMNWKVNFMGGDAVNSSVLVDIAGNKAAEGFYFLSPLVPENLDSPQAKKFLDHFKKVYDYKPSSIHALLAGDAFIAIEENINKLKTTNTVLLSDYLHRKYFNPVGLTGQIRFNTKGDVVNDLHAVYRVDANGRFILQRLLQYGEIVK